MATTRKAAQGPGGVYPEEILKAIRHYRNEERQKPEGSLEAEVGAALE